MRSANLPTWRSGGVPALIPFSNDSDKPDDKQQRIIDPKRNEEETKDCGKKKVPIPPDELTESQTGKQGQQWPGNKDDSSYSGRV
jgi:hypothetical protein